MSCREETPLRASSGSGLGLHRDGHFIDGDESLGAVAVIGGGGADLTDDIQTGGIGGFAEGGILAVEVGDFFEADEELRSAGVRVAAAGHGEDAWFV